MAESDKNPIEDGGPGPTPPKVNGVDARDITIKLRKPVIAHGEEVSELKFREPTAADIIVCGTPVIMDLVPREDGMITPKMRYETDAMFAMMSRLAVVPPSTIKQMHPKDWENAALALAVYFFTPDTL